MTDPETIAAFGRLEERIEELEVENSRLRKALAACEWGGVWDGDGWCCPCCDQTKDQGHAPGCIVGEAMAMAMEV